MTLAPHFGNHRLKRADYDTYTTYMNIISEYTYTCVYVCVNMSCLPAGEGGVSKNTVVTVTVRVRGGCQGNRSVCLCY